MSQRLFNRECILEIFNEPEVFDGVFKREQRGDYDPVTGDVTMVRLGFNCRVIPNSGSASEGQYSLLDEVQRSGGKVKVALTTNKINYDANWDQVSTEIAEPPIPEKDDLLEYNNRLFKIVAAVSNDLEGGVLYELLLAGS